MIAELHDHSVQWDRPNGFARRVFDWRRTVAYLDQIQTLVEDGKIPEAFFATYQQAANALKTVMESIPKTSETWGLIHGDFMEDHYVFREGKIHPIVFAYCRFGYLLYDLAIPCMHLSPEARRGILDGYGSIRRLSDGHQRIIEIFLIAEALHGIAFHGGKPEEAEWLKRAAPRLERMCRKYLAGDSILF